VHIPFCRSKCGYCDFSSFAGLDHLYAAYVDALLREIALRAPEWAGVSFDTLYVGGGTPSLLAPERLAEVLRACRRELGLVGGAEITVEANPGTVDLANLRALVEAGVNRLSLGVQSLRDGELRLLGRTHSAAEALRACQLARDAGFSNLSIDLIFGLPRQRVAHWRATLEGALAQAPEHLSLYALTLEPGTPLAERVGRGDLRAVSESTAASMYELSEAMLAAAGYAQYEISNWARYTQAEDAGTALPALACKHNLKYWRNEQYLGLGAAAHSYDGQRRYANVTRPDDYIGRMLCGVDAVDQVEETDVTRRMGETMMLGLRLNAGVSWGAFEQRFGVSLRQVYGKEVRELEAQGLLQVDEQGMRLSPRGRLLGNRVFCAFLR
jgi:oxygen-independent coproporphyrinogen-3 oxidase